jgi:tetratricopeptide (TPR) repeat protein
MAAGAFEAQARGAFRRHPASGLIADLAAERLLALDEPGAIEWIDRALRLGPKDPVAHRLVARAMVLGGQRDQALTELRAALEEADDTNRTVLCAEVVGDVPEGSDLLTWMAALPPRAEVLHPVLHRLAEARRWQDVAVVADMAIDADRGDLVALRWRVTAGLGGVATPRMNDHAARLAEADRSDDGAMLAARAFESTGAAAAAERVLDAVFVERAAPDVAEALARLASARGDDARAEQVIGQALARAVETANKTRLHRAMAALEERRGNTARAAAERAAAARLGP